MALPALHTLVHSAIHNLKNHQYIRVTNGTRDYYITSKSAIVHLGEGDHLFLEKLPSLPFIVHLRLFLKSCCFSCAGLLPRLCLLGFSGVRSSSALLASRSDEGWGEGTGALLHGSSIFPATRHGVKVQSSECVTMANVGAVYLEKKTGCESLSEWLRRREGEEGDTHNRRRQRTISRE